MTWSNFIIKERVLNASIIVDNVKVSSIDRGLCVLIGLSTEDTNEDLEYIVKKILNVKVFDCEDGEGKEKKMWARSVKDAGLEVLCVSQFTLYGNTRQGNKPDFHNSMKSETSKTFYANFINRLKQEYIEDKVKDGIFGAMMNVHLVNEGPVTLELDSRKFIYVDKVEKTPNKNKSNKSRNNNKNDNKNDNKNNDKESVVE
ncbi:8052_t:CDS:2 [Entrophospora sp. SA101]|nr:8052_t:CDS:2 [Entrophospora sp. SA101]